MRGKKIFLSILIAFQVLALLLPLAAHILNVCSAARYRSRLASFLKFDGYIFSLIFTLNLAFGLPSDRNQPYLIIADTAIYDRNLHITSYIGDVVVTQGSSQLKGDKAIVYQDSKNLITHVVTFGKQAEYSTLPEPGKDRMYATADKIDYNPNDKVVILRGKGNVKENNELFSGPYIWYDMVNGLVQTKPTKRNNERTVIVLPGNNPKRSASS